MSITRTCNEKIKEVDKKFMQLIRDTQAETEWNLDKKLVDIRAQFGTLQNASSEQYANQGAVVALTRPESMSIQQYFDNLGHSTMILFNNILQTLNQHKNSVTLLQTESTALRYDLTKHIASYQESATAQLKDSVTLLQTESAALRDELIHHIANYKKHIAVQLETATEHTNQVEEQLSVRISDNHANLRQHLSAALSSTHTTSVARLGPPALGTDPEYTASRTTTRSYNSWVLRFSGFEAEYRRRHT